MKTSFKILFTLLLTASAVQAACLVRGSNGQPARVQADPLFTVLKDAVDCPQSVQKLKAVINQTGLATQPYMVANRGFHNPNFGSFSFFEQVTGASPILNQSVDAGEFFFGHFTTAENNLIIADQEPSEGKLLVELIAWDNFKNLFNFYELIGTGKGAQWIYRGDSEDILADNAQIYLNPPGSQFGSILRCSACHTSGGPIMKELAAPHNDWWTKARPLSFAPNKVSAEIADWVHKLGEASELSQSVKIGMERLEASPQYQKAKQGFSLQATLRPLFCEMEINLESDLSPLDQASSSVQIPSTSIVNPILATGLLNISSSAYRRLLSSVNMRFPETNRQDADHGWLAPVKGHSDLISIQTLIEKKIINEEFASDVLAVDFHNPLFSSKRCGLLQLMPLDGLANFADRLKSSVLPGARELYENLTNPLLTRSFHVQKAKELLSQTQAELSTESGREQVFRNLMKARQSVFNAEISQNPRGQILEPGFRVIFPVPR